MTPIALKARAVFPVATPPIEGGVVTIDGGRIVEVGRRTPPGAESVDLGDVVLLPGLVNAHTHLEFSRLKKRIGKPGVTLPDWVRLVIAQRPTARQAEKAIAEGLAMSLAAGVTTVADICRLPVASYGQTMPAPRMVLLQESIGYSQARSASALSAAQNGLAELQDSGARPDGRCHLGVSPHAPYTASPQLVRELVGLAVERQLPVALHLAEAPEELELMSTGSGPFQQILEERGMWDPWSIPRGTTPQDYLRMLTLAPSALVVHGNYLDHSSLAMIGRHAGSMSLVYCPRTHLHFKHKPYPLGEALSLGVRVCLGTDSLASSPDLSVLAEMREVIRLHPEVSPESVLRMGTLSGAEALGLNDLSGSIRVGLPADLAAIPARSDLTRPGSLLESVLGSDEQVSACWASGRQVL